MMYQRQFITLFSSMLLGYASLASAGSLSGGDAASAVAADTYVDLVLAIDTSGSMSDEASSIDANTRSAVTNLDCPGIDVWVNARFVGIQGTWAGTLFDERADTVLTAAGDAETITSGEDNGPVVYDFALATNYWVNPGNPGQKYVKAIITIGDEGLQNGEPVNQDDYDAGKAANDAAITNKLLVFSIIGNNPSSGAPELFTALAEGGAELGGHQFLNAGGFAINSTDPDLETRLEEVICTAGAGGNFGTLKPVPTLSWWSLIALVSLLTFAGYWGMRRFA